MSQTTLATDAVAVTVTPAADADLVIGPKVLGAGFPTHIHTGSPISPIRSSPASGTIPIPIGSRSIAATARAASSPGFTHSVAGPSIQTFGGPPVGAM